MHSFYKGSLRRLLGKHNGAIPLNYEWYRNVGKKGDEPLQQGEYQPSERLSLFGDLQYRHIGYRFTGMMTT